MGAEDGDVGGTGIDPDVEGVAALGRTFGKVEEGGEFGVGLFEPDVGAFFFDEVGDLTSEVGGDDRSAIFFEENGKGDAPGALTRDAPVGTRLNRSIDAIAAPFGKPLDFIDFAERFIAELVDRDEELLDGAEDDGRLGTPAMGVAVGVGFLAKEGSFFREDLDDAGVAIEDVNAHELGDAAFVGEESVVIDRAKNGETVLLADGVIVRTVTGRDMDCTCS